MHSDVLDTLLPYYRAELTYLRRMGAAFAEQYPKVAGRLEFSGGESADPHIERLIESFALLTGRIQYNLDGELPEVTTALLGTLYPQFMQPVPSMAVAHFDVDPNQGKLTAGFHLKPETPLFAEAHQGVRCRFRTAYDTTLWPFRVVDAGFEGTDRFEFLDVAANVATVLRIRVQCEAGTFGEFDLSSLRFHLAGDHVETSSLYELIFGHTRHVAIQGDRSKYPVFLRPGAIRPVGFEENETVLPYPPNAHEGYRLLQEYFAFPEQFLFFDVHGLERHGADTTFDLLLLLDEQPRQRLAVKAANFLLNCCPVINLFSKTSEPIRLDHRQVEYRLSPDTRRERTTEVHSVRKVSAATPKAEDPIVIQPYFSVDNGAKGRGPEIYWHARRRPAAGTRMQGTDVFLSFTDLSFTPEKPPTEAVFAHTLCTNRHLADELPNGALLEIEVAAPVSRISCLGKPTSQIDPPLGGSAFWRLISHLTLNHLSIAEGKDSVRALREILRLYSPSSRSDVSQQITGIREVDCRRTLGHVGRDGWRGFCQGMEITLTIDERSFVGSSGFLLAAVLDRFLGLYAAVNSFTQLTLRSVQRDGIWKKWEPRAGAQSIL